MVSQIAAALKNEIVRLSRREIRSQIDALRKASQKYRKEIGDLKKELASLRRTVARADRGRSRGVSSAVSADGTAEGPRVRFASKGLKPLRERLGLSQADLGRLLDVSAQSVYNWERGTTRPRANQIVKIASLRKASKKEVQATLAHIPHN